MTLSSTKKKLTKRLSKSTKQPQTMEKLLAQMGCELHGWRRGDVAEGIITEKTKRAIYLDIGGKSEAMVIDREMKAARDFIKGLKIGDKVQTIVTQPENDKGQTLLSLKRAAADQIWGEFEEKLKTGVSLKVKGKEVNRGGLVVEVKSLQGFIPASCFGAKLSGKVSELVDKILEVRVIEVDREKNRLIFSEKEVSEAGLLKAQQGALAKIKTGDVFKGQVTGVMPFGLFVKVQTKDKIPLEGLVHISEISWEKVEEPVKFHKEGDKVEVKVLAMDQKSGKLNLSLKQLMPDPWKKIKKKYKKENRVKGKVVRLAPFGAFVLLEPGIEGLIHISKIPAEKSIDIGDKVDCYVEMVDPENRRMSLGLVLKEKPVGYK